MVLSYFLLIFLNSYIFTFVYFVHVRGCLFLQYLQMCIRACVYVLICVGWRLVDNARYLRKLRTILGMRRTDPAICTCNICSGVGANNNKAFLLPTIWNVSSDELDATKTHWHLPDNDCYDCLSSRVLNVTSFCQVR